MVTTLEANQLEDVLEAAREAFDDESLGMALEVCLSAAAALCIKDLEGCPAILLEGPPASRKTTVLRCFPRELENIVYHTDKFTPAAFVSHHANKTEEQLGKIDLLPKIGHKVMLVPEMRVTFSDRPEKLAENLGTLTRVLDGHGLHTDSGAHGGRGYGGDYKFTFIGATTPLSQLAWQQMSNVGSRLLVLDVGGKEPSVEDLAEIITEKASLETKVASVKDAVSELLSSLWESGYGSVEWNTEAEKEIAQPVAALAQVTAHLRGHIQRSEYGEESRRIENPTRLAVALMNIARGHALAAGRREVIPDDIEDAVGCSAGTALRLMGDLVTLGLAKYLASGQAGFEGQQQSKRIRLADDCGWLVEA